MSKNGQRPRVKIVEGFPELGESFGIIMSPEPIACPKCRSTDFKRLLYGLPAEDLSEDEKEFYRLGGCVVREEQWHCEECGFEW